jgi:hypothetical protein
MPGPEVADAIPPEAALTLEPPRFDFVPGKTIAIEAHLPPKPGLDVTYVTSLGLISPQLAALRNSCFITRGLQSIPTPLLRGCATPLSQRAWQRRGIRPSARQPASRRLKARVRQAMAGD